VAGFPAPAEGIVLTHFLVSDDVDRSRAFYTEVLGGEARWRSGRVGARPAGPPKAEAGRK
jgi:catechol 2,3-dioxygenase-like lactoylglutathione lyase family enzyme